MVRSEKANSIVRIVRKAKAAYNTLKSRADCPPDEMLLDYVENILSEDKNELIYQHIQKCERCHVEVLRMEADRTEWECMIDKNPDAAVAKALGDIENSEHKIPEKIVKIIKGYPDIFEDARKNYNTLKAGMNCPSDGDLFDYAREDILLEDQKKAIYEHIQKCERCHVEILKMEADRTEWEYMIDNNPDAAVAKALGTSGLKKTLNFKKRMIKTIKGLRIFISPLWEPQHGVSGPYGVSGPSAMGGGYVSVTSGIIGFVISAISSIFFLWKRQRNGNTAAVSETPEQYHSVAMDDGKIEFSCYWKPKFRNNSAYIQLSWCAKIRITNPVLLWVRFMNPENNEIHSEICLGSRLEGKDYFTSDKLGFDPSNDRWAISIIVEEIK